MPLAECMILIITTFFWCRLAWYFSFYMRLYRTVEALYSLLAGERYAANDPQHSIFRLQEMLMERQCQRDIGMNFTIRYLGNVAIHTLLSWHDAVVVIAIWNLSMYSSLEICCLPKTRMKIYQSWKAACRGKVARYPISSPSLLSRRFSRHGLDWEYDISTASSSRTGKGLRCLRKTAMNEL